MYQANYIAKKRDARKNKLICSLFNSDSKKTAIILYLSLVIPINIALLLLLYKPPTISFNNLTIKGIPVPLVAKFFQDKTARNAYFQGDRRKLHDRLKSMGIETKIKEFYQTQIPNEDKLDQHIHQIFYDVSGYVGEAYQPNTEGILVEKY